MKKLTTFLLTLFLGLTGCSSAPSETLDSQTPQTPETETMDDSTDPAEDTDSVVVYFTGTGNTEKVAEMITKDTGSAIFEIEPAQPYTGNDLNFNDENSRIVQEYENPDERDTPLSTTEVPNWSEYKTVYLGYPIWWGIAAWPTDSFVRANNFDGKTVYTFCTSLSSPIGSTTQDLEALTNTGDWQEGHRFPEDATEQEVSDWLKSIGK